MQLILNLFYFFQRNKYNSTKIRENMKTIFNVSFSTNRKYVMNKFNINLSVKSICNILRKNNITNKKKN